MYAVQSLKNKNIQFKEIIKSIKLPLDSWPWWVETPYHSWRSINTRRHRRQRSKFSWNQKSDYIWIFTGKHWVSPAERGGATSERLEIQKWTWKREMQHNNFSFCLEEWETELIEHFSTKHSRASVQHRWSWWCCLKRPNVNSPPSQIRNQTQNTKTSKVHFFDKHEFSHLNNLQLILSCDWLKSD